MGIEKCFFTMKVHPGTLILLLLSWTAQETFCKRTTADGIARGKCGNVCTDIGKGKQWCDDYCKNNSGALVKVYLGPVMPKQVPLIFTWKFDLCQDGKCVEAAWIDEHGFMIGASQPPSVISKEGYFIKQTDVTRVLVEQGWSLEKQLTARMRSLTKKYVADNLNVENLPEPVVIVGKRMEVANGGGRLTLNPNQDRGFYGDLLDKYFS